MIPAKVACVCFLLLLFKIRGGNAKGSSTRWRGRQSRGRVQITLLRYVCYLHNYNKNARIDKTIICASYAQIFIEIGSNLCEQWWIQWRYWAHLKKTPYLPGKKCVKIFFLYFLFSRPITLCTGKSVLPYTLKEQLQQCRAYPTLVLAGCFHETVLLPHSSEQRDILTAYDLLPACKHWTRQSRNCGSIFPKDML